MPFISLLFVDFAVKNRFQKKISLMCLTREATVLITIISPQMAVKGSWSVFFLVKQMDNFADLIKLRTVKTMCFIELHT